MRRRILGGTSAIALLLLAAAYTYHFLYWNFDDTYIVFRIVRNLLSGHGWAFDIGEAHNASTSVLNTLVVALATPLFSWNIPYAAHVLAGVWLSVAAAAFGWIFWQRAFASRRPAKPGRDHRLRIQEANRNTRLVGRNVVKLVRVQMIVKTHRQPSA